MHKLGRKLTKVSTLFRELVLFSEKTYFLDEVNRQKKEKSRLAKQVILLNARNEVYLK
jgi:hypothetical protein